MIITNTKYHRLRQTRPQFCWTAFPKGFPELETSLGVTKLIDAVQLIEKLEEDIMKIFSFKKH